MTRRWRVFPPLKRPGTFPTKDDGADPNRSLKLFDQRPCRLVRCPCPELNRRSRAMTHAGLPEVIEEVVRS
jgi:hypothetical protein